MKPQYRSALKNIYLSTMFYTKHIGEEGIGWSAILDPLNRDLVKLESVSSIPSYLFECAYSVLLYVPLYTGKPTLLCCIIQVCPTCV